MNFPNISIVYNRLGYNSKTGYYPVYFRIYYHGQTDYLRIRDIPKIHERDWIGDARHGRWVSHSVLINNTINTRLQELRKYADEQVMNGAPMTMQSIKEHYINPEKLKSFNSFAADYVKNINRKKHPDEKLAYRTIQTYRSFLVKLDAFNPNLGFSQINRELLEGFNDYLAGECKLVKTSRAKHFDKFHVIYEAAGAKKLVDFIPGLFKGYRARSEPKHTRLDLEEIKKFKHTTLPDPVDDFYRIIFFLQLLTGMYLSDLRKLTVTSVKKSSIIQQGKRVDFQYIEDDRMKNGRRFLVMLSKDSLDILKKHSSLKNSKDPGQLLFPDLISDQKYNKRLKRIARRLGIDKPISNKTGRHSYGVMMVGAGNTRDKVGKTMGHTKDETTRIYSDLSPEEAYRGWIEPDI